MSEYGDLDPIVSRFFPGAVQIARVESTVLLHKRDIAIHVYPFEFSFDFIQHVVNETNELSQRLRDARPFVSFHHDREQSLHIQITPLSKIDILPDGRVYTEGKFCPGVSLDHAKRKEFNARIKPSWLAHLTKSEDGIYQVFNAIDQTIVHEAGDTLPEGYLLAHQNVLLDGEVATVVDIFSSLARKQMSEDLQW